ncbi:MAG TPA: hypothetical protein VFD82_22325 [Planctomycetota bacterium]|nr:hypothetical protein [Planctomycetota bacterium]
MHTRTHSFAVFLVAGSVGAFVTAFAFIAVLQLTLPPTNLAYGQGIIETLRDPFVRAIATPVAIASGALATPLLYFCLRHRRLSVALPIVFASVLIAVAITTPLHPWLGLYSAFAALVCSCIACSQIRATRHEVAQDAD